MTDFRTEPHAMTRVDIHTGMPFAPFVTAFEDAAPAFDPAPMQRIVDTGGTWDDVRTEVAKNAPNELMRYWQIDAAALLGVAGHRTQAVEYLVRNHVIAESMFRHDPKALLYAPLRMLVYSDATATRSSRWTNPAPRSGAWESPRSPPSGKASTA